MPTRERIEPAVAEFFERGFNARDVDYIEGVLADDFIEHNPFPGLGNDKKGALETFRALFAGTPDLRAEVLDLIVSGNKAAIRARFGGTDSGTGQLPGVAPTGKPYTTESIDVVTVDEEGRFTEHYGIVDVPAILRQLGLMPTPGS
jgi:predicted ester cyclase